MNEREGKRVRGRKAEKKLNFNPTNQPTKLSLPITAYHSTTQSLNHCHSLPLPTYTYLHTTHSHTASEGECKLFADFLGEMEKLVVNGDMKRILELQKTAAKQTDQS